MSNVGDILREKREQRGLSLKDVEAALSIRVKYLEALELGDYSIIPGEVYAKGFLRNYAKYLGLDADEMMQFYKDERKPPVNTESGTNEKPAPAPKANPAKRSRFGVKYGIAALLVIVAGGIYLNYPSHAPEPSQTPSSVAPAPRTPSAPPVTPPQNIPQTIKLSAKATSECWVMIVADGKEVFEGILNKGETKTWQAKTKMEITLGNAGGVEITYNDQPQAPLGAFGDVVRKVYVAQ